jgi:hypothetical protein
MENNEVPEKFQTVITDFVEDLSTTFPEFAEQLAPYKKDVFIGDKITSTYEYCTKVLPERFFDILYQNEDIFDNDTNTSFLPDIDFKQFMKCEDISDNTRKVIWKYLQLILFTVIENVKDKSMFGDSAGLFEGIDEKDLQEKLSETMNNMSDFFKSLGNMTENMKERTESEETSDTQSEQQQHKMPDLNNIQDHLSNLFNGKIGSLAKEMAEELTGDFGELFGEDVNDNEANPQDVMKNLMKDPKKLMKIMKKVSTKLDDKMKNGDISREDIMKEAGDLMGQFKDMAGGDGNLGDMMKNIAKNIRRNGGGAGSGGGMEGMEDIIEGMGGAAGMAELLKNMGGLGKNMRIDQNAVNRMTNKKSAAERAKKHVELRRQKQLLEQQKQEELRRQQEKEREEIMKKYNIQSSGNNGEFVYRIDGVERQEKSFIHPDLLKEMEEEEQNDKPKKSKNKKKKAKKGKIEA